MSTVMKPLGSTVAAAWGLAPKMSFEELIKFRGKSLVVSTADNQLLASGESFSSAEQWANSQGLHRTDYHIFDVPMNLESQVHQDLGG